MSGDNLYLDLTNLNTFDTDAYYRDLLLCLLHHRCLHKTLNELEDASASTEINKLDAYYNMLDDLTMMNVQSGASEDLLQDRAFENLETSDHLRGDGKNRIRLIGDNAPQSSSPIFIKNLMNCLRLTLPEYTSDLPSVAAFRPLIEHILKFEMCSYADTDCLILMTQLMRTPQFWRQADSDEYILLEQMEAFDCKQWDSFVPILEKIHERQFTPQQIQILTAIAEDVYHGLFEKMKDARLFAILLNEAPLSNTIEKRSREDNTTRIELLYSVENGDAYCIRLDMAHPGEEFFHLNYLSGGRNKTIALSANLYQEILKQLPNAEALFIQTGSLYYLRDTKPRVMTKEQSAVYKAISGDKIGSISLRHEQIFRREYDEQSVLIYLDILSEFLKPICYKTVAEDLQQGGMAIERFFTYNKQMWYAELYFLFAWRRVICKEENDELNAICLLLFQQIMRRGVGTSLPEDERSDQIQGIVNALDSLKLAAFS